MDDVLPIEIEVGRADSLVVDLGEPQPDGATFVSQIRTSTSPDSHLIGEWTQGDLDEEGVLTLALPYDGLDLPVGTTFGFMDIVRMPYRVTVLKPTKVVFIYGPTVIED